MNTFKRLSDQDLAELQTLGFIHASGLSSWQGHGDSQKETLIEADQFRYGQWYSNNGVVQFVTEDGQVWLGGRNTKTWQQVLLLAKRLCPKGEKSDLFVHCSNGESIHFSYVLSRLADPYEDSNMTVSRLFASRQKIVA